MDDDPIPDDQHIARLCSHKRLDSLGRPMYLAFQLRQNEEYWSANWLEYLGPIDRRQQILALRKVLLGKGYDLRARTRFAVLNIGEMRNHVFKGTAGKRNLSVLHKPEPSDLSHSGVFGATYGDDAEVAALIAEKVLETHQAKD